MANANGTVIDDMPPEMDYREHERTYEGFVGMVKLAIVFLVLLVVGLYLAIIAHNPWMGIFFIVLSLIVPPAMLVMRRG